MKKNNWKEIITNVDLPEYGKYVLVLGIDRRQYSSTNYHVCYMDDMADGVEFMKNGNFYWLTENGTEIKYVRFWKEIEEIPLKNYWLIKYEEEDKKTYKKIKYYSEIRHLLKTSYMELRIKYDKTLIWNVWSSSTLKMYILCNDENFNINDIDDGMKKVAIDFLHYIRNKKLKQLTM
ncbi:MAG: hypothetical protein F2801_22015 [Actinobacteria bacterium]|nr:hypothetical protein [Actinomycetota bacterium]